jgi:hypothetical protein
MPVCTVGDTSFYDWLTGFAAHLHLKMNNILNYKAAW